MELGITTNKLQPPEGLQTLGCSGVNQAHGRQTGPRGDLPVLQAHCGLLLCFAGR